MVSTVDLVGSPWTMDVRERLRKLTTGGKLIRGSLFLQTIKMFNKDLSPAAYSIAAALELLHTGLLIHDDIIDHDRLRRGNKSIHAQYEDIANEKRVLQPKEFGEAMAICVGDITFFTAFRAIAVLSLKPKILQRMIHLISTEFMSVGFGEINDVTYGYSQGNPRIEDVLQMYKQKTARYTFSLPFMLGVLYSDGSQETSNMMEKIGESLGMIYQIQDDLLTIRGIQSEVGKTIGNDISENKKTIPTVLLLQRANSEDINKLNTIYGNPNISSEQLSFVYSCMERYEVFKQINQMVDSYTVECKSFISTLPISSTQQSLLMDFLQYLLHRGK